VKLSTRSLLLWRCSQINRIIEYRLSAPCAVLDVFPTPIEMPAVPRGFQLKQATYALKSLRHLPPAFLPPWRASQLLAAHTQGNLKMNSKFAVNKPMEPSTPESVTHIDNNVASSSDADLNPLWVIAGAMAIFFAAGAGLLAMG
jgi:hypothetical protein